MTERKTRTLRARLASAVRSHGTCFAAAAAFTGDPIGVLTVPVDARLEMKTVASAPGKPEAALLARVPSLVQLDRARAGSEDAVEAEILVWERAVRSGARWARAQLRTGERAWLKERPRWAFSTLESRLKGKKALVSRAWDRVTRAGPQSNETQTFEEAPEALRFVSYAAFRPAKDGGAAPRVGLHEAPDGPRMAGRRPGDAAQSELSVDVEDAAAILYSDRRGEATDGRAPTRAFVYETKGDWLKVRLRAAPPYVERWAWLRMAPEAGEAREFESEGEKAAAIDGSAELSAMKRSYPDGYHARAVNYQDVQGRAWALLEVYRENLCDSGSAPAPAARGWVPVFEEGGAGEILVRPNECE